LGNCCNRCFDNEFIIYLIKNKHELGSCDYCESKGVYISDTKSVGEFIREKLVNYYININDDGLDPENYGDNVFDILNWEEGIFSEILFEKSNENKLFEDLMEDSGPDFKDVIDGDSDYFEGGDALIVLKDFMLGSYYNSFSSAWNAFKYQCKHFGRYFDFGNERNTREALLKIISDLFRHTSLNKKLTKETLIWRARLINPNYELPKNPLDILKEVSPAPIGIVKNNRMSPAGISYFYGADKPETCIAEIKPSVGEKVLLSEFELTTDLAILDLTLIPNFKVKSIFDPDYNHEMRWAQDFMERFINDISRPMTTKDLEIDYIPTQVLAEYIRKEGYNGLKYESSQRPGEYNYVLFYGPLIEENIEFDYENIAHDVIQPFNEIMTLKQIKIVNLNHVHFNTNDQEEHKFSPSDFIIL
jgi:RES domain.